jgi:hypothetical protein
MKDFDSNYPGQTLEDLLKDYDNGQLVKKTYSLLITAPGAYKVESTKDAVIYRLGSSFGIAVGTSVTLQAGPSVTVQLTRDGYLLVSGSIPEGTEITYTATTDIVKSTDLVQSDWDEEHAESLSYIKNRPFGITGYYNLLNLLSISESTIGTNLFEVYPDVCFQIGPNVYNTLYELGKEIILSLSGPTVVGTVVKEGEQYFVRHISGTYLLGDVTYCDRVDVKIIPEAYIPENIARPSDVKYVTQSLTEEQKEQARKNIGAASTAELQKMYNELLALIQGGGVTPTHAVLDEAVLDEAVLS